MLRHTFVSGVPGGSDCAGNVSRPSAVTRRGLGSLKSMNCFSRGLPMGSLRRQHLARRFTKRLKNVWDDVKQSNVIVPRIAPSRGITGHQGSPLLKQFNLRPGVRAPLPPTAPFRGCRLGRNYALSSSSGRTAASKTASGRSIRSESAKFAGDGISSGAMSP